MFDSDEEAGQGPEETVEEVPIYEEVQDPILPLTLIGAGAGAATSLAAARALGLVARLGLAGAIAGAVGLALREFLTPMRTTLLTEELQVRFGRRTRFRIPLKNVVQAYARQYSPLREFGGWGIRFGMEGRAFNMRGSEGVQLVLRSGAKVLIGSQRSEELAEAVRAAAACEGERP